MGFTSIPEPGRGPGSTGWVLSPRPRLRPLQQAPRGRRNVRFARACCTALTAALLVWSVACAGQAADTVTANWRAELASCFVRGVCVDRDRAEQLLMSLDRLAASSSLSGRPNAVAEVCRARVDGWRAYGDPARASVALASAANWAVNDPRRVALRHSTPQGWLEERRCAIEAGQHHWRSAAGSFVRWRAPFYRDVVAPACLVPLAWAALWMFGRRRRSSKPSPLAWLCAGLCLAPLFLSLFGDTAMLAAGLAASRNPFGALLRPDVEETGRHLAALSFSLAMLWAGYRVTKVGGLPAIPRPPSGSPSGGQPAADGGLPLRLAAVVVGVAIVAWPWFRPSLALGVVGGIWEWPRVARLVEAGLLFPIASQYLLQYSVLRVMQRFGGMAFAVVFTAMLSAGLARDNANTATHLLAGLVYAAQFIRFRSLSVPIATQAVVTLLSQSR